MFVIHTHCGVKLMLSLQVVGLVCLFVWEVTVFIRSHLELPLSVFMIFIVYPDFSFPYKSIA